MQASFCFSGTTPHHRDKAKEQKKKKGCAHDYTLAKPLKVTSINLSMSPSAREIMSKHRSNSKHHFTFLPIRNDFYTFMVMLIHCRNLKLIHLPKVKGREGKSV
jgi:hypothetical protein